VMILPRQYLPLVDSTYCSNAVKPRVMTHCAHGYFCSSPKRAPTSFRTARF
jgi:hypothetical protein